jgi:hypothetical protein
MTDLDRYERFLKWAAQVQEYRVKDASKRFETYEAYMKQREAEAIQERAKRDE